MTISTHHSPSSKSETTQEGQNKIFQKPPERLKCHQTNLLKKHSRTYSKPVPLLFSECSPSKLLSPDTRHSISSRASAPACSALAVAVGRNGLDLAVVASDGRDLRRPVQRIEAGVAAPVRVAAVVTHRRLYRLARSTGLSGRNSSLVECVGQRVALHTVRVVVVATPFLNRQSVLWHRSGRNLQHVDVAAGENMEKRQLGLGFPALLIPLVVRGQFLAECVVRLVGALVEQAAAEEEVRRVPLASFRRQLDGEARQQTQSGDRHAQPNKTTSKRRSR